MSEQAQSGLAALRDKPFELLREMERLSSLALGDGTSPGEGSQEWVGIGFKLANEKFLVERKEIREVMILPAELTRVPGAKDWVAGLTNLRGHLLTVIDLRVFLGAGTSKGIRTGRVLVIDSPEMPVGIIVDEVFGFRRFSESEFTDTITETELRCERYMAGTCSSGTDVWPIFSLKKLLDASEFQQAAA
jgi:twitching motility protein PilI